VREHAAQRRSILARWGVDLGGLSQTICSGGEWSVSFTTPAVLGTAKSPAGWCLAGPLMDRRVGDVGTDRPLVYAALGTFTNRMKKPFEAIIAALAGLDVDALISTGGHLDPGDFAPLPANVAVQRFVDSREVLGRAAVHVTHGGGSSVHESLVAAVPMVCLPQGSDQWGWSGRMVACGVGVLSGPEPAAIRAAILRQLESEAAHAAAKSIAAQLLSYPGNALISETVESILTAEAVAR
jgi:MGT family glycosyltransferase